MPVRFPRRRALALAAVLALGSTAATAITPLDGYRDDPDRLVMVTVHWQTRAQLQQVAGRFQHLIVDEKRRTARVEANATELAALQRMGLRVEIDAPSTERMRKAEGLMAQALTAESAIPGYVCYRTVEETYSTMNSRAAAHPSLASVVDIGPSWTWAKTGGAQGYRMRVLRLNNTATDATVTNKPNMVVLAAIHAREYTTAELTTRFAEWLVNGYGNNAEATWLLDNFRFHFILQANPDGRKRAESGLSWRKNTDTDNGSCSANAYGVDLNRNFGWRFGTVAGGSSPDPCDVTYRGPGAESEEEVQNILRYVVGTPGGGGTYTGGVLADRRTDARSGCYGRGRTRAPAPPTSPRCERSAGAWRTSTTIARCNGPACTRPTAPTPTPCTASPARRATRSSWGRNSSKTAPPSSLPRIRRTSTR